MIVRAERIAMLSNLNCRDSKLFVGFLIGAAAILVVLLAIALFGL
jgi:hypothetical protein